MGLRNLERGAAGVGGATLALLRRDADDPPVEHARRLENDAARARLLAEDALRASAARPPVPAPAAAAAAAAAAPAAQHAPPAPASSRVEASALTEATRAVAALTEATGAVTATAPEPRRWETHSPAPAALGPTPAWKAPPPPVLELPAAEPIPPRPARSAETSASGDDEPLGPRRLSFERLLARYAAGPQASTAPAWVEPWGFEMPSTPAGRNRIPPTQPAPPAKLRPSRFARITPAPSTPPPSGAALGPGPSRRPTHATAPSPRPGPGPAGAERQTDATATAVATDGPGERARAQPKRSPWALRADAGRGDWAGGRRRTVVAVGAVAGLLVVAMLAWRMMPGRAAAPVASRLVAAPTSTAPAGTPAGAGSAVSSVGSETAYARAEIPGPFMTLYLRAAGEYHLDWAVLAAIGQIRNQAGLTAFPDAAGGGDPRGAPLVTGAGQRYAVDGDGDGRIDPYDPADAIPSMAAYLRASGAPADWQSALFAYGHAHSFVDAVLALSRRFDTAAP